MCIRYYQYFQLLDSNTTGSVTSESLTLHRISTIFFSCPCDVRTNSNKADTSVRYSENLWFQMLDYPMVLVIPACSKCNFSTNLWPFLPSHIRHKCYRRSVCRQIGLIVDNNLPSGRCDSNIQYDFILTCIGRHLY